MLVYKFKTWIQSLKSGVSFLASGARLMLARCESVKYIRKINSWTPKRKERIRLLLNKISTIAGKGGIDLILFYGALLGHIRHGKIMPWDDDVDLVINESEVENFIKLLSQNAEIRYQKFIYFREDLVYYKLWLDDGEYIPSKEYTFPFVDLWIFHFDDQSNVRFSEEVAVPANEFYPIIYAQFEEARLAIPRNPHYSLDLLYPDWRTRIQVYAWSHRLERVMFKPVAIKISVNSEGRIDARSKRSIGIG